MEKHTHIVSKAQAFVKKLLDENLPKEYTYHNYAYTEKVVKAVEEISDHAKLRKNELEITLLAAWFHTTGYIYGNEDHLEASKRIAREFLKNENVAREKIEKVAATILDTNTGQSPVTEMEKVICDAILYPVSQSDYLTNVQDLKKEWEHVYHRVYSTLEWYDSRIKFVVENNFHTEYGKEALGVQKDKVLKDLKKKMKKHQTELDLSMEKELGVSPIELKNLKKKLLKVEGRPERGIETMFRLTSKNHLTLSGMADTKANIMISVNSIILSILIGSLMQKLDNNPQLTIPTYVMLFVNLGSIIFSILSTRPNITSGRFTREDIENNKTNLLFFGNFHKMQRADYQWGMHHLMEDGKFLYSSLIDDIFFLGVVLGKKYRYLRVAYNIFMYGLVLAVVTFMISNMIYGRM